MQGALSSQGAASWLRILESDDSAPMQSFPAARAHARETISSSSVHATHELTLSSSVHASSRTSRATSPGMPERGGGSRGNSASPQKAARRKTRSTSPVKVTLCQKSYKTFLKDIMRSFSKVLMMTDQTSSI